MVTMAWAYVGAVVVTLAPASVRDDEDRSLINVNYDHELRYWTKELGVSEQRLRQAVKEVGTPAAKVREVLNHVDWASSERVTSNLTPLATNDSLRLDSAVGLERPMDPQTSSPLGRRHVPQRSGQPTPHPKNRFPQRGHGNMWR